MRWEREAFESRAIWPYHVQENIIKVEASGELYHQNDILETNQFRNWKIGAGGALVDSYARWNLFNTDQSWTDAQIELSLLVEDAEGLKQAVLPPGMHSKISFAVLSRCAATRWRNAITQNFNEGNTNIILDLNRSNIAGEVEILPSIILQEHEGSVTSGWASTKASILATGYPIYVYADEPQDRPGGGIDIKWESFPDKYKESLYKLDWPEDSSPVIYMNNQYPALQSIIDKTSKAKNNKTRIRDALFGFIAVDIWMQLAKLAAERESDTEDDMATDDIHDKVLNTLSHRIKWNKDKIKSSFNDEASVSTGELHQAIQHYLTIAKRQYELITETQK